ncbi:MAG TPA: DMT family transporter [Candidatus Thioglobus sp.]|nr:DMT family transporter [Candidatus Thioglobus sp.]
MKSDKLFSFLMALAMLAWAGSFVSAKYLAVYINEHELVTYRYLITTLTTLPVLMFLNISYKIDMRNLAIAAITAILLVAYTKLFFLGTKIGTASLGGALITTLMPIIAFVIVLVFSKKKPIAKDWLALFIGAIGVSTMLEVWQFDLDEIFSTATVFFLWAATSWALMSIATSQSKRVSPILLSFYIYLIATLFNTVFFYENVNGSVFDMDGTFWLNMLLMSIASTTFAATVYVAGMQRWGSKCTVFTFLVPFFVIVLSATFLGESIQVSTVVGALLTVAALVLINNIKLEDFRRGFN